jgi:hypothetical protein
VYNTSLALCSLFFVYQVAAAHTALSGNARRSLPSCALLYEARIQLPASRYAQHSLQLLAYLELWFGKQKQSVITANFVLEIKTNKK